VPCPALSLALDEIYEGVAPMTVQEREAEYERA
jgi:hypothetical protein